MIETVSGLVPVQDLSVGDLVKTAYNGYQPIRWIGSRKLDRIDLAINPKLCLVRIKASALGFGLPERDLVVSWQHRVLLPNKTVQQMLNAEEALIAAIHLTPSPAAEIDEQAELAEYFHLLFDRHEIIFADGVPIESLFLGPETLKALGKAQIDEIFSIFPELCNDAEAGFNAAALIPEGRRQKRFTERHLRTPRAFIQ